MSVSDPLVDLPDDEEQREPLEFLAQVMAGTDPRQKSEILQLVETIEAENFGDPPDEEQWDMLKRCVERLYKHQPVALAVSASAARTIAEYKHAKRKSLEISETGTAAQATPLTDEELDLFEAWFHAQY